MKSLKTILGIALATATLGGAVAVGVAETSNNSFSQADAATESLNAYNVVFADENTKGFNTIHFWSVSYESGYGSQDLSYWFTNYRGAITTGSASNNNTSCTANSDGSFDVTQSTYVTGWYSKSGRQYVFLFPHYVKSFSVIFKHANDWNNQSPTYALSSRKRCVYGAWNNGTTHYYDSGSDDTNHKESFTYYNVTRKYNTTTLGTDKAYAYSYYDVPAAYAPAGYSFKGWYKDSGFTQAYSTDAVLTADMTLYAKCQQIVYSAYLNGSLVGNLASTTTAGEYKITLPSISHGDLITFRKDGSSYAVTKENSASNNYDNGVIFSATNADLYLKTNSNQFWLAGMPNTDNSHYLLVNGDLHTELTINPDKSNEKYGANLHFEANDIITFAYINASGGTYSRYSLPLDGVVSSSLFVYVNDAIKCVTAGYYNIFVGTSGSNDKAYLESINGGAAYEFALDFNTKIGAICETAGSAGYLDSLEDEWGEQSDAFADLHVIAKDTLKTATPDDKSSSEIEKFAAKYLRIMYLYGTTRFPNFVGRTDVTTKANNSILFNGVQGHNSLVIIAIVGLLGVSATGIYFFIRKRKHQ